MPTWNSEQYLKFGEQRTQPARDLAARITLTNPRHIVDLGCGPGNSTAAVAARWPSASIRGVDNSSAMLAAARRDYPQWTWEEADIEHWRAGQPVDLIFSNAALQWVSHHGELLRQLMPQIAPGGALAFQAPANLDSPAQRIIRDLAESATWRSQFTSEPRQWFTHPVEYYYDTLAPLVARIDTWYTDYIHPLPNVEAIADWYRGTGLRPWLDSLPNDDARERFVGAYRARLVAYYPTRVDGCVLFPFRRLFVIAYR